MSSVLEGKHRWPGLGEVDLDRSMLFERGIYGKAHGVRTDFRWLAASPGLLDSTENLEAVTGLGPLDSGLHHRGAFWKSLGGGRHLAMTTYPSRARDADDRPCPLERQVLVAMPEATHIGPALLALLALPWSSDSPGDGLWWPERNAPEWGDPGFMLPIEAVSIDEVELQELEQSIETGIQMLEEVGEDRLLCIYRRILHPGHSPSLVTEGLEDPLPPEAVGCLLLPLRPEQALGLSFAGWLYTRRIDLEMLAKSWSVVFCDEAPRGYQEPDFEIDPAFEESARLCVQALLQRNPSLLVREAVSVVASEADHAAEDQDTLSLDQSTSEGIEALAPKPKLGETKGSEDGDDVEEITRPFPHFDVLRDLLRRGATSMALRSIQSDIPYPWSEILNLTARHPQDNSAPGLAESTSLLPREQWDNAGILLSSCVDYVRRKILMGNWTEYIVESEVKTQELLALVFALAPGLPVSELFFARRDWRIPPLLSLQRFNLPRSEWQHHYRWMRQIEELIKPLERNHQLDGEHWRWYEREFLVRYRAIAAGARAPAIALESKGRPVSDGGAVRKQVGPSPVRADAEIFATPQASGVDELCEPEELEAKATNPDIKRGQGRADTGNTGVPVGADSKPVRVPPIDTPLSLGESDALHSSSKQPSQSAAAGHQGNADDTRSFRSLVDIVPSSSSTVPDQAGFAQAERSCKAASGLASGLECFDSDTGVPKSTTEKDHRSCSGVTDIHEMPIKETPGNSASTCEVGQLQLIVGPSDESKRAIERLYERLLEVPGGLSTGEDSIELVPLSQEFVKSVPERERDLIEDFGLRLYYLVPKRHLDAGYGSGSLETLPYICWRSFDLFYPNGALSRRRSLKFAGADETKYIRNTLRPDGWGRDRWWSLLSQLARLGLQMNWALVASVDHKRRG